MNFGVFIPPGWRHALVGIDPAQQWGVMAGLARHDAPVLGRVDADQVVPPALGDEQSEFHRRSPSRGPPPGDPGPSTMSL